MSHKISKKEKLHYVFGHELRGGKQLVLVSTGATDFDAIDKADKYYYKKYGRPRYFGSTYEKPTKYDFPKGMKFVKIPKSFSPEKVKVPRDIVDDILDYESGRMTRGQEKKFFSKLKKTGLGYKLQGHYSSRM